MAFVLVNGGGDGGGDGGGGGLHSRENNIGGSVNGCASAAQQRVMILSATALSLPWGRG